jgi:hypothetical protein
MARPERQKREKKKKQKGFCKDFESISIDFSPREVLVIYKFLKPIFKLYFKHLSFKLS